MQPKDLYDMQGLNGIGNFLQIVVFLPFILIFAAFVLRFVLMYWNARQRYNNRILRPDFNRKDKKRRRAG